MQKPASKAFLQINLLPQEFTLSQLEQAKFKKIQFISLGVIFIMVVFSMVTLGFRIDQLQKLSKVDNDLKSAIDDVSFFSKKEYAITVLKNRVDNIGQLTGHSKQGELYALLSKIVPAGAAISSLSIDRSGNATMALALPNSDSLEPLINNLMSKDKNEGKINQVLVDGLSRNRDGNFRVSLVIKVNHE